MKYKRDDNVYLQHIHDAAAKIGQYIQGIDEDKFLQNSLVQDGVDLQIVWTTATDDIPEIKEKINKILEEEHVK